MKKTAYLLAALLGFTLQSHAVDNNTVEIVYNGSTATVTVADNISSYVTVSSGTSSHVDIVQSSTFAGVDKTSDNEDGLIFYVLKGSSTDGSLTLTGSFKCEVDLNGLALTNPNGPALNIKNGKCVEISAKKNSVNTLADGKNSDTNGCIHSTGHLEFKGKGTLSVVGNSKHGIYSKEYMQVKNLTLNITSAKKDGIHCKEYFLMESGTLSVSNTGDDGIQCELSGETSTGEITPNHKDEDSGNFYQLDGKLTISSFGGKAINAAGAIDHRGGTKEIQDDVATGIWHAATPAVKANDNSYELGGRRADNTKHGVIIRNGKKYAY